MSSWRRTTSCWGDRDRFGPPAVRFTSQSSSFRRLEELKPSGIPVPVELCATRDDVRCPQRTLQVQPPDVAGHGTVLAGHRRPAHGQRVRLRLPGRVPGRGPRSRPARDFRLPASFPPPRRAPTKRDAAVRCVVGLHDGSCLRHARSADGHGPGSGSHRVPGADRHSGVGDDRRAEENRRSRGTSRHGGRGRLGNPAAIRHSPISRSIDLGAEPAHPASRHAQLDGGLPGSLVAGGLRRGAPGVAAAEDDLGSRGSARTRLFPAKRVARSMAGHDHRPGHHAALAPPRRRPSDRRGRGARPEGRVDSPGSDGRGGDRLRGLGRHAAGNARAVGTARGVGFRS